MNRSESRRINRTLGLHRAADKKGSRPAVRPVVLVQEQPERHRTILPLPFRLAIVRTAKVPG